MVYKQLFFVGNKMLGETVRNPVYYPTVNATFVPASEIYICSCCGDVIARCPVYKGDALDKTTPWETHLSTCERCADKGCKFYTVPASLWNGLRPTRTAELPRAVLLRELYLHEKYRGQYL